jgi:hypothetical protein
MGFSDLSLDTLSTAGHALTSCRPRHPLAPDDAPTGRTAARQLGIHCNAIAFAFFLRRRACSARRRPSLEILIARLCRDLDADAQVYFPPFNTVPSYQAAELSLAAAAVLLVEGVEIGE